MYRIFIVEDDRGIAEGISALAQRYGFEPYTVTDFRRVMEDFARVDPQLVLLDISLPFFDGYHFCGEIRKISKVPVIFISSASDNMNVIMAMNMGADDFIAKPFDGTVLIAKIGALLRRSYDFVISPSAMEYGGACLNTLDASLSFDGKRIELSKNEYRILYSLMEARGGVVSRELLMQRLWETDCFVDENTLSVNVNRLRKKLDGAGLHDYITTRTGVGYALAPVGNIASAQEEGKNE